MHPCIALADAIVEYLNDGSFALSFDANRRLAPSFSLQELESLQVSVVPKVLSVAPFSRTEFTYDIGVDIGIQKRVDPQSDAEIDSLMTLVAEVLDYLLNATIPGHPSARWTESKNEPIYSPQTLDEKRVFMSVITVMYSVTK